MHSHRSKLLAILAGTGLLIASAANAASPANNAASGEKAAAAASAKAQKAPEAAASTEGDKVEGDKVDAVASGPKVTTQQHGDWLLECYDPAINNVNCQIKQRIVQKDSDQNILVMSMAFDPKAKTTVIQYVLPLDFLLTPGVSIEVGDYRSTAGINRCAAQGCFVEGTTDEGFIKAMQAAKSGGRVVIVSRTGQKVGINFSSAGFSKAYDAMVGENTRLASAEAPKN